MHVSNGARNLFISHAHKDDDNLQGLKDLLGRSGYTIRDGSIDSAKPNNANNDHYIKYQLLAPRIDWASTLVVLISPITHTRAWVNWEIEYAARQGKRIVGVYVHGGQDSDLPVNFRLYGDALVGWQADRVMGAVNGTIDTWFKPDGAEFPERDIERFTCGEPTPE